MVNEQIDILLKDVLTRHVEPEDVYEITAILESEGINDAYVNKHFGFFSVFDLAQELWTRYNHNIDIMAKAGPEQKALTTVVKEDIRQFLRGSIFALPMVLSITAMLTIKLSLWSYINLSLEYATAIGIGTFLSFATVGGFMQAIARRSYLYVILGYYRTAKKVTFQLIRYGIIMSLLITAAYLAFNLLTNILTPIMLFLSVSYFLVLNAIWLGVTAMYVLRKEVYFTGLIVIGIGLVYLLFYVLHINVIVSQLISMLIVGILGLFLIWFLFKQLEKKEEPGTRSQPSKISIAAYSLWPYFLYGSGYFVFLFTDRIMAWSTNEVYMPFYIWFRSKYELGLDFSLLMMVIPMGIIEVVITRMMNALEWSQKNYHLNRIREMNQNFTQRYFRLYRIMAVVSLLSAVGIYFLVYWLSYHFPDSYGKSVFWEIHDYIVFFIALLSYAIISVSLLNIVVMFSLSEPQFPLKATMLALSVDALVGFLFSRWLGSDYAVIGLFAGSMLFLFLSTKSAKTVLNQLDYYLYNIS